MIRMIFFVKELAVQYNVDIYTRKFDTENYASEKQIKYTGCRKKTFGMTGSAS